MGVRGERARRRIGECIVKVEADLSDRGLDIITARWVLWWNLLELYWVGWRHEAAIPHILSDWDLCSWGRVCVCAGLLLRTPYACAKGRAVITEKTKKGHGLFWKFFSQAMKLMFFSFLSSLNCCFCKQAERRSFLWRCQWLFAQRSQSSSVCGAWTAKLRYIALEKQTHTRLHGRHTVVHTTPSSSGLLSLFHAYAGLHLHMQYCTLVYTQVELHIYTLT